MTSNRNELLSVLDEPLKEIDVPYRSHVFRLREMNEEDSVEYELVLYDKNEKYSPRRARRKMLSMMVVDNEGKRVFTEDQLKKMPRSIAGYLYSKCLELNSYEPEEIENIIKNCGEAERSD